MSNKEHSFVFIIMLFAILVGYFVWWDWCLLLHYLIFNVFTLIIVYDYYSYGVFGW